jgi:predicted phage baseplate assembly protein
MDLEFLTQLPKSNLDDRTFKDLVDECLLRIPRYCPEWTNHNPSDPGVTLIELFAWLTDQMLLRFNQVPRRNYVAFLEMLGVRLQPPAPAQTILTFYLTRAQDVELSIPAIPAGAEVATERTEDENAVVFSTNQDLPIGFSRIRYFLTAEGIDPTDSTQPFPNQLHDRFTNQWATFPNGRWIGRQQTVFQQIPRSGDCFYLVFDGQEALDGNVIDLTIEGEPAGSTGINPKHPPRHWEAWTGEAWEPILLKESHDGTQGFSFDDVEKRGENGLSEAEIRLHLPLHFPTTQAAGYTGRWIRCYCVETETERFSRSPTITMLWAQTIGAQVPASQCTRILSEQIGESDGNPGQMFSLQSQGILPRQEDEHLQITPPGEAPQYWTEVENFANSGPSHRHYTIDARTGRIQFGPLIREPKQLQEEVQLRRQIQWQNSDLSQAQIDRMETLERQYGAVPPRGALIQMTAYRTGGGDRGNVPKSTLKILKTALPYVKDVTNHLPGRDGANEETLEEAVLRVPQLLRTRDRAVTPEDFETLAMQATRSVGRVYCPRQQPGNSPGMVKLYVIPRANLQQPEMGLSPDQLALSPTLRQEVQTYLDDRRLLGTEVQLEEPDYVGVAVEAVIGIDVDQNLRNGRGELIQQLSLRLYQFLNPLTGGRHGTGWKLGSPLYQSDLVGLVQHFPGVQFLESLQIIELRRQTNQPQNWQRQLVFNGVVYPGPRGIICSWQDVQQQIGHQIQILDRGN